LRDAEKQGLSWPCKLEACIFCTSFPQATSATIRIGLLIKYVAFISSQFVWRAIQTVTGKSCFECLPYIVATFLAIVPIMLFAPSQYSHVALIVWGVLISVAAFYWMIAGILHEAKRIGRKMSAVKEPSVTQ
jgi:hypothetical protein